MNLGPGRRVAIRSPMEYTQVATLRVWTSGLACFVDGLVNKPDPGPRLLRKIRDIVLQGSQVPCLQTTTAVSLGDVVQFLRGDGE